EATRDALVWVSGNHDDRIGGPSQTMLDGGFHPRRTVYAFVDRLDPPGLLSTFDFPSPAATSPARDLTTVSPQALFLMNSPLTLNVAEQIANRLECGVSSNIDLRTTELFRLIFSRDPSEEELSLTKNYLGPSPKVELYQQFIHALLLTNEFVFVD
ncbi:MAG: DUF1553 domain-containing protein, partial [Planctomycetes bacterium]|nr:DUF1553 domain-containing protein [Planctomycetota bacterium]